MCPGVSAPGVRGALEVLVESCSDQGVEWEELLGSLLQSGDFQVSQPSASAPVVGRKTATGCSHPVPDAMVGILATHPFPQDKM